MFSNMYFNPRVFKQMFRTKPSNTSAKHMRRVFNIQFQAGIKKGDTPQI